MTPSAAMPDTPRKPAQVRPTAMVKAVLREAARLGYDAKLNPDGSLELVKPSPQSPQSTVASEKRPRL